MTSPTIRSPALAASGALAFAAMIAIALHGLAIHSSAPAMARSRGMIGASGNPAQGGGTCNRCHGGGTMPQVSLSGPTLVEPDSTQMFTLTISGGQAKGGGLNVSASDGVLLVPLGNNDVQASEGEITHLRPKNADASGDVVFHFLWNAPDEDRPVTLYAAGNSVDLSGNTAGDAAATDTFQVTVDDETDTPEPSHTPGTAVPTTETPEPSHTPGTALPTTETPEPSHTPATAGPTTETPAPGTATPTPMTYETVFADLKNPHGLSTIAGHTYLVAEGGTGDPVPGQFAPGNGDGRVQQLGPQSSDRTVILDGLTNAQDPGGGVVGANHAIQQWQPGNGGAPESVILVAQSGGPGHLRPAEAARILKVTTAGTVTVLADTLAFETAHNPGGETGPDALDSNPWRLKPLGPKVLVVDSGANDVLSMDPVSGELALFAVFAPLGESQAVPTGIAVIQDVVYVALLGPMVSDAPEAEIRRLEDVNGDGDALDEGENTLLVGGLRTPTDLAVGPRGHLYVLEMFPGTLSRINPACWRPTAACDPAARTVVATDLTAATAMTWADNFDALVTIGPRDPSGLSLRTDRVVRVPWAMLDPFRTPTPPPSATTPPVTATTPPPPPTTPVPGGGMVYLPLGLAGVPMP